MRRFLFAIAVIVLTACRQAGTPAQTAPPPVITAELRARSQFPDAGAAACARCHQKQFDEWLASQHARANRLVDPAADAPAFNPPRELRHGSFVTTMREQDGRFVLAESFSNRPPDSFHAEAVIAIEPLRQYLVTAGGGRLQAAVVAFDPRSNDWFNTQGTENRQPHEWGFWTNRSMTWNVQCAFCHMTGLQKNYNPETDGYRTTWDAMGVSCAQCHPLAPSPAASASSERTRGNCPACAAPPVSTNRAMDNCASCHARREEMTATFRPGERFDDHYRLTLPDTPTIYYADGQIRDEDFEYGSFRMSRMCHKGVTCFDCHNPHSGKLKLPATNNAVCMQCHTPPGLRGAIAIDPVGHSHHSPTNSGFLCVDCHMPETPYMVRDPRRDHGFTSPDPQLTLDLGIPNACNRCHADKDAKWANEYTRQWYGEKMERPARRRAYAVTRATGGNPEFPPDLLALAAAEEVPAWRATLDSLLAPWAGRPDVAAHLTADATNGDALVRSAVLRALAGQAAGVNVAQRLQGDATRLVRVDAAWSLMASGQFPPSAVGEVQAYLDNVCDQPAGALRRAEFALNLGRQAEAEQWARRAAAWDPSAAPQHALGRILHAVGKTDEALQCMLRASRLTPDDAGIRYDLSLLYGELNRTREAVEQLRETTRLDPRFGRAWYNLGLGLAALEQLDDALAALARAQVLMPDSPEPPFARATILLRQNRKAEAVAAAQAALKVAPGFQAARQLIESAR